MVCTLLVMAIGSYASYVFSGHNSVHAIWGLVIMLILMPTWTLFQNINSLKSMGVSHERAQWIRKWMSLSLLLFIFPTQWMLGIQYITYETGNYTRTKALGYFLGHYFPAYCFMLSGVLVIYVTKMETIMKGEAAILGPAAFVAMIGELVNDLNGSNPHFWHHIILEGAAIMLCVLCYIVYKLELPKRNLLHGLCMGMFWGIF